MISIKSVLTVTIPFLSPSPPLSCFLLDLDEPIQSVGFSREVLPAGHNEPGARGHLRCSSQTKCNRTLERACPLSRRRPTGTASSFIGLFFNATVKGWFVLYRCVYLGVVVTARHVALKAPRRPSEVASLRRVIEPCAASLLLSWAPRESIVLDIEPLCSRASR